MSSVCVVGQQRSDRMAVCLSVAQPSEESQSNSSTMLAGGQQLSEPCVSGTIQLPPDGNPLILLAEHQTTGGYKAPGVVIKADLWQVGQMRPGDQIRFVPVTAEEATEALAKFRTASNQIEEIEEDIEISP